MVHNLVAAILVRDDRILLGLCSPSRAFYPNVWDTFGGHIEPGEQPEQSLIRELQEELNITPTQWIQLETLHDSVPERDGVSAHDLLVHFYCVTDWAGTPINHQLEEHSSIQWFSYKDAVKLDLAHHSYPRLFLHCLQRVAGIER